MKKILISFALILASSAIVFAGEPVKNFADLMDALKKGQTVKVVIYYGKCQLISDNEIEDKSPDAIGGLTINTYEYFAAKSMHNENAFLATSETKLIQHPRTGNFVYNYVKIKITDDNKVQITAKYVDAKTYETVMDESFYTTINDGTNSGAFYLFKEN
jgi:hypothetical protein